MVPLDEGIPSCTCSNEVSLVVGMLILVEGIIAVVITVTVMLCCLAMRYYYNNIVVYS